MSILSAMFVIFLVGATSANHPTSNFTLNFARQICKCGTVNPHVPSLTHSKADSDHSFPWKAALMHYDRFICSGNLINDRYVLTGAHCFHVEYGIEIKCPEVNVAINKQMLPTGVSDRFSIYAKCNKITKHAYYNDVDHFSFHDLALVRLRNSIKFNRKFVPVCLPMHHSDLDHRKASITEYRNRESTWFMVQHDIRIQPENRCVDDWAKEKLFMPKSQVCVHHKTTSTRIDPSASLTLMERKRNWVLVGLSSYSKTLPHDDSSQVYTKIDSYMDWIARVTNDALYCYAL